MEPKPKRFQKWNRNQNQIRMLPRQIAQSSLLSIVQTAEFLLLREFVTLHKKCRSWLENFMQNDETQIRRARSTRDRGRAAERFGELGRGVAAHEKKGA